jgi:hypothetical protein
MAKIKRQQLEGALIEAEPAAAATFTGCHRLSFVDSQFATAMSTLAALYSPSILVS